MTWQDPLALGVHVSGFSAVVLLEEERRTGRLMALARQLQGSPQALSRWRGVELERLVHGLQAAAEEHHVVVLRGGGLDPAAARRSAHALAGGGGTEDESAAWLTTKEVAERWDMSTSYVARLVRQKRLVAAPREGRRDWWISERSVAEFERARVERPAAPGRRPVQREEPPARS